jgi:hypothetical protein
VSVLKTDAELASEICAACTTKLGLEPMPQPRRPPMPCPRCGGYKFIRACARHTHLHVEPGLLRDAKNRLLPAGVTWELDRRTTQYGAAMVPNCEPALDQPRGKLSFYVCAACGLTELYCDDPESIPVGPEYMTDVVDYTAMQR